MTTEETRLIASLAVEKMKLIYPLDWDEVREIIEEAIKQSEKPLREEIEAFRTLPQDSTPIENQKADSALMRVMEKTCPDCGHDLTVDGCANCLRQRLDGVYRYALRLGKGSTDLDIMNAKGIIELSKPLETKT